jgi:hypothetical protein
MPETLPDCAARCHDPRRGRKPGVEAADGCEEVVHARDAKQLEARNIDGKPERDQERKHGEARASDPPALDGDAISFRHADDRASHGHRRQDFAARDCLEQFGRYSARAFWLGASVWPRRDSMSSASATRSST